MIELFFAILIVGASVAAMSAGLVLGKEPLAGSCATSSLPGENDCPVCGSAKSTPDTVTRTK